MPASRLPRLSRDARQLIALTEALAASSSRLEDSYWEQLLSAQINKVLQGKKNKAIESVLEHFVANHINAYEILVEQAETLSESTSLTIKDIEYDVLLFSAPLVAWTRYQLPGGQLDPSTRKALSRQLQERILAPQAGLALLNQLVCFDQMPQTFQETWTWTRRLGLAALNAKTEPCPIAPAPDSEGMLADARFLVGTIVVPKGQPLFRWQTSDANAVKMREQCLADWTTDNTDLIGPLFTGCSIEYLLPDAYYMNSREADRRVRPLALKAAVTWLQTAAGLPGSQLRAAIVACGESTAEEYRVGFSKRQNNEVVYGCIWPILSKEEAMADSMDGDQADIPDEIAALLKEFGVDEVRRLPGIYSIEFCDDCGAPYFPNALGEMLHPELPEETDLNPVQFH